MTNMPTEEPFVRSGIATVCISIPTYWLLVLISWREKLGLKKVFRNLFSRGREQDGALGNGFRLDKVRARKGLKPTQSSATNSTLQRRLTSLNNTPGARRSSAGHPDQELDNLTTRQNGTGSPSPVVRRATVQFADPFPNPIRQQSAIVAPDASDLDERRPERVQRAQSMEERTGRSSTPRRAPLFRRFSTSASKEKPVQSPV